MGQGQDGKRKGNALANAAVATASVALGYAALELGFGGVLKPGREAIQKSLQPEEEAEAQLQQGSQLVTDVDEGAKAHESTTSAPLAETDVVETSKKHADADADAAAFVKGKSQ